MRLVAALVVIALGSAGPSPVHQAAARPIPLTPETMAWRPAGPGLEMAIADGTPAAEGQPFTMIMRIQPGAGIAPHTHNVAKRLLVMTGELRLGFGPVQDDAVATSLRPGSFFVVPAEQAHFETARGETIVAMYGVGPFRTTFLK